MTQLNPKLHCIDFVRIEESMSATAGRPQKLLEGKGWKDDLFPAQVCLFYSYGRRKKRRFRSAAQKIHRLKSIAFP